MLEMLYIKLKMNIGWRTQLNQHNAAVIVTLLNVMSLVPLNNKTRYYVCSFFPLQLYTLLYFIYEYHKIGKIIITHTLNLYNNYHCFS